MQGDIRREGQVLPEASGEGVDVALHPLQKLNPFLHLKTASQQGGGGGDGSVQSRQGPKEEGGDAMRQPGHGQLCVVRTLFGSMTQTKTNKQTSTHHHHHLLCHSNSCDRSACVTFSRAVPSISASSASVSAAKFWSSTAAANRRPQRAINWKQWG